MTDEQAIEAIEAYEDRNLLALLCGELARELGYTTGFRVDPDEPDWPVLIITLPTGQISYHLPKALVTELFPTLKMHPDRWDGHTTEQKRLRIKKHVGRQFVYVR